MFLLLVFYHCFYFHFDRNDFVGCVPSDDNVCSGESEPDAASDHDDKKHEYVSNYINMLFKMSTWAIFERRLRRNGDRSMFRRPRSFIRICKIYSI